jgi:virginiamycin B lyase
MRYAAFWPLSISLVSCVVAPPSTERLPAAGADSSRLPAGEGRAIVEQACTGCHNLEGLWAYQGYYDERRWRGLVDTMIAHGAELNETDTTRLVDYLVEHFGPGTR